jgi:hypothetical protein
VPSGSAKCRIIGGALSTLVLSALLSFGTVYGLNRYLGPIDDPQITGSFRDPQSIEPVRRGI